jgi:hypothetical protein
MKKTVLLFLFSVGILSTWALGITNVDNAVRGTGPDSGPFSSNQFFFTGSGWVHSAGTTDPYYQNTVSYSNQTGNYVVVRFYGTKVEFFGAKASHHGIAAISIDNGQEIFVDQYASQRQNNAKIFESQTLVRGEHSIKIRVTGTKNTASSNTYVIVDYVALWDIPATNTSTGLQALQANITGWGNVANGYQALNSNVSGTNNTAVGSYAMKSNIEGNSNTAVGASALGSNNSGGSNVAIGSSALVGNTSGSNNIAIGTSLQYNSTGNNNISIGPGALDLNQTGNGNVAIGSSALLLHTGSYNTAIGYAAGYGPTVWGPGQGVNQFQNSTAIGNLTITTASNQVRIGNSDVSSIGGQVSWSTLSDGRFKKDIKEDVSGLDFIKKLRPVSYTVDKDAFDTFLRIPDSLRNLSPLARKKGVRQTGFVAQEVEAVIKKTGFVFDGVEAPQHENDHYSIRYAEFVVPLVKAVQELTDREEKQKQLMEDMQKEILTLKEGLQAYTGGALPEKIESVLYQNNPNPFSTDTEIKMEVSESAGSAVLMVYNLEGRQLKDVRVQGRGKTSVKIGGSELNAGMYLYALIVDGKVVDTKRMILTK